MGIPRWVSSVLWCACAIVAVAYEVPMGTRFERSGTEGLPEGWSWHAYAAYLPHGDAQVPEPGALRLFNARGTDGAVVRSRSRMAVRDGELVTVSFAAKGEGRARYTLYLYDAKGGWVAALPRQEVRLAKESWRKEEFAFVVRGSAGRKPAFAALALGVSPGGDATFRDVRVSRRLVVERVLASDDFEDAAKSRAGCPERIVDHIAPGLLAPTGQGVYSTRDRVDLVPEEPAAMPSAAEESFLTSGVRIYAFGRRARADARLEAVFADGTARACVAVMHQAASETLACTCPDGGRLEIPYAALPADFAFSANGEGLCELVVTSLADSSVRSRTFKSPFFRSAAGKTLARRVSLVASGTAQTEVSVDNLLLARSAPERRHKVEIPFRACPEPEFDPVKAGWPLVFSDEFDGDQVDFSKWERAHAAAGERQLKYAHVKDGALHIAADRAPGSTNLVTTGFWSREDFGYGYFESRLRFTTYNGWWAAFWLCQHGVGNPFLDGFEIDIFEDYYMRNEPRNTLDHNLHTHCAGTLKSWNYNSVLPGGPGDWYVIGCKWTPLEITYYLNGKAIAAKTTGGAYETVTFDAFRNAACICPLKAIVSGQIMKTAYGRHDPVAGETYPEFFDVDWVRVYRWPGAESGKAPTVSITSSVEKSFFVAAGRRIEVRAQVRPGVGGAKIKAVHLFDNGCHLLTRTGEVAQCDFVVPMTQDFFARTAWMKPGRSGVRPVFAGSQHVFCVFAEDESGLVGHSGTVEVRVAPPGRSTPYGGVAQKVPGTIVVGRYDEGGNGIAYYDSTDGNMWGWRGDESVDGTEHVIGGLVTGEWVNYTVDVAEEGAYRLRFRYGTPDENPRNAVLVLIDGERAGRIEGMKAHEWGDWRISTTAEIPLALSTGRHVLSLHFSGSFNVGDFEIVR